MSAALSFPNFQQPYPTVGMLPTGRGKPVILSIQISLPFLIQIRKKSVLIKLLLEISVCGKTQFFNYKLDLKFCDGDGPNLCRVKKVDVSSTFIENIFQSGLTLVSSNNIITIKIDKK